MSSARCPGRSLLLTALAVALATLPAAAAGPRISTGRSPTDLAAAVVRATADYRAALERALPAYEAEVKEAGEALEERRSLHSAGMLPAAYVEDAQRSWVGAQRNLAEARAAIAEADRIILAGRVQEELARLTVLPRGGYDDGPMLVRFNGGARWSLRDVPHLEELFTAAFGRPLPISSFGQTKAHDRLGLDHRAAVDVAVHPDSAEGRWLMQHLRGAGIPFIGVRAAVPGASTGAHVHIGVPSARLVPAAASRP